MNNEITGRAIGGKARAASMSQKERSEIAKKASNARWDPSILDATHGNDDHPLTIGGIDIPCYVFSDGKRVLLQRGIASAIGIGSTSGKSVAYFAESKFLESFLTTELLWKLKNPIKFRTPKGPTAHGYEATILADICDAVLSARKAGKLLKSQERLADQCELLVRGFAKVGIIALVDEATGYQKDRAKDALAQILEAFVAQELQPYISKFPRSYYEELFRLRELKFDPNSVKRPPYFGHITNDIIYRRLAPGVWKEIKKKSDSEKKKLDRKSQIHLHRFLTTEIGDPRLKELITRVTTIMQLSTNWNDFKEKLNKLVPPLNETLKLPIELENDTGIGL